MGLGEITAVFIRAPWIESAGEKVEILASVESNGVAHPVLARQGALLAASFHPEIVLGERYAVHEYFINEIAS